MYKLRLVFEKKCEARFISHLDLMHVFQRSFARAGIYIWQTEGFNRHSYVSIALPLPVGFAGDNEIIDFNLMSEEFDREGLISKINCSLPSGIRAVDVYERTRPVKDISYGEYTLMLCSDEYIFTEEDCGKISQILNSPDTMVLKKSKSGEAQVRLHDFMPKRAECFLNNGQIGIRLILQAGQNNLNPVSVFCCAANSIERKCSIYPVYVRNQILDGSLKSFR